MSATQTACFFSEWKGSEEWQQGCGRKYSVCVQMYTHLYVHTEHSVLIQRNSPWPNRKASWFEAVVHTGSTFSWCFCILKRVGASPSRCGPCTFLYLASGCGGAGVIAGSSSHRAPQWGDHLHTVWQEELVWEKLGLIWWWLGDPKTLTIFQCL